MMSSGSRCSLRSVVALARLALLLGLLHGASAALAVEQGEVAARVSVDAEGRVDGVEILDPIPAPLERLVESAARRLEFEPARRDGRAVASRTTLRFDVRFTPGEPGKQLARVEGATTEVAWRKRHVVPWPRGAGRDGYGAWVLADLALRPDGSVDGGASRVEDVVLVSERGVVEDEVYRRIFERAVLRSLGRWSAVPEELEGAPVAARVKVAVTFCQRRACAGMPSQVLEPNRYRSEPLAPGIELARLVQLDSNR